MRTIIMYDSITDVRYITEQLDNQAIPAYAFAISNSLLPLVLQALNVTNENLALGLSQVTGLSFVDSRPQEYTVVIPQKDISRILLHVYESNAYLSEILIKSNTLIATPPDSAVMTVADWGLMVSLVANGVESEFLSTLSQTLDAVVVDMRKEGIV